jgi:hypothetical protein|mmetsp:Transcript_70232/g.117216  ORF Transcript_70232/g.117216 Transcript_70232/m.117216 type:complete len:107 (+) Transcript_70232:1143-1463(+)
MRAHRGVATSKTQSVEDHAPRIPIFCSKPNLRTGGEETQISVLVPETQSAALGNVVFLIVMKRRFYDLQSGSRTDKLLTNSINTRDPPFSRNFEQCYLTSRSAPNI